jgi:hypothetical protein
MDEDLQSRFGVRVTASSLWSELDPRGRRCRARGQPGRVEYDEEMPS